jgi:hypothetical protein
MRKKLIITEKQYKVIKKLLSETTDYQIIVNTIVEDLNNNYVRAIETYLDDNEYKKRKCFEVVADGRIVTPGELLEYFKGKYKFGENFLRQVITDWCDYKAVDGALSKNVGLME